MAKERGRNIAMSFSLVVVIFAIGFLSYVVFVQYGSGFEKFEGSLSSYEKSLEEKWLACIDEKTGDGLNIEYLEDVCYLNVLGLSVDLEDCKKIVNEDLMDVCYLRISINKEDSSACSLVSSEKIPDCHLAVALKTNNLSFCEELASEEQAESCKNKFGELK